MGGLIGGLYLIQVFKKLIREQSASGQRKKTAYHLLIADLFSGICCHILIKVVCILESKKTIRWSEKKQKNGMQVNKEKMHILWKDGREI